MSDIHNTPTRKLETVGPGPKSRTFVVAGNWAHFRLWQDEDYKQRRTARYVRDWNDLRGWPRGEATVVLFIGSYYARTDIRAIVECAADNAYETVFESALSAGARR